MIEIYLYGVLISFIICVVIGIIGWRLGEDLDLSQTMTIATLIILSWLGIIILAVVMLLVTSEYLEDNGHKVIIKGRKK